MLKICGLLSASTSAARQRLPTLAELETLAGQTVQLTPADADVGRLEAAPGRQTGRCVALALAWRDALFPDGTAATATADNLLTGRRGLLAALVAAGGWVTIKLPRDVEDALAALGGVYAMVVWEPAGQALERRSSSFRLPAGNCWCWPGGR